MTIKTIPDKTVFGSTPTETEGVEGIYENTTAAGDFIHEFQRHRVVDDSGLTWKFVGGLYASKAEPSASGLTAPLGSRHKFHQFNAAADAIDKVWVPNAALTGWIEAGSGPSGAPTGTTPQAFTIASGAAVGDSAGAISAADPNSLTLSYSFAVTQTDWEIDPSTGAISVRNGGVIDFATTPNYSLLIYVSNGTTTHQITADIAVSEPIMGNFYPVSDIAFVNGTADLSSYAVDDIIEYKLTNPASNSTGVQLERHRYKVIDVAGNNQLQHIEGVTMSGTAPTTSDARRGADHRWEHHTMGGAFSATDNTIAMYRVALGNSFGALTTTGWVAE